MARDLPPTAVVVPKWMAIAFGEIGVIEDHRPGASNHRIETYHAITRGGCASDDTANCSSFGCWAVEMAGISSPKSKRAADWANWGVACGCVFGAAAYFPKTDPDAGGSGHMGFVAGSIGEIALILGCNQTIRYGKFVYQGVNIVPRLKADGLYRWPHSVQLPSSPPKAVA